MNYSIIFIIQLVIIIHLLIQLSNYLFIIQLYIN